MDHAAQPVDLVHLDRYTGGDRRLNAEILRLFDDQSQEMLAKLERMTDGAPDAKAWKEIMHSLKGAARGIGAFSLADAAAAAETAGADRAVILLAVERIKTQSAAVQQFIEAFLARGD